MKTKKVVIMASLLGFSGIWASSEKPKQTEKKTAKEIEISYAEAEKKIAKEIFGKVKDAKHWPYVYLPVWTEKVVDEYSINGGDIKTNGDGTIIADASISTINIYNFVTKKTTSFSTKELIHHFEINNDGSTIITQEKNHLNFYIDGILDEERSGKSVFPAIELTDHFATSNNLSLLFISLRQEPQITTFGPNLLSTKIEVFDSKDKKIHEFMIGHPVDSMSIKQEDTLVLNYRGLTEYIIEIYRKNSQNKSMPYEKIYEFKNVANANNIEANNDASVILSGDTIYYRTKDSSYKASKLSVDRLFHAMNNSGSIIYAPRYDERAKLYKYTNIVLEYWNQLTSAHLDMIQAFYYGLNKFHDKQDKEKDKKAKDQFETFKSMPWPIIQGIIKIYPIKFTKEQTTELKAIKADFDKQKPTSKEKEKKSEKEAEKKDKGESKKTTKKDEDKK